MSNGHSNVETRPNPDISLADMRGVGVVAYYLSPLSLEVAGGQRRFRVRAVGWRRN
jgi:hypothetical protein